MPNRKPYGGHLIPGTSLSAARNCPVRGNRSENFDSPPKKTSSKMGGGGVGESELAGGLAGE